MPGPAASGAAAGPGPDPEESYDFLFKLVLIGDASVGKTCLVQRFKTGAFAERQGSTIGVDFTMKSLEIQGKRVKVSGAAAWGGGSGRTLRFRGRQGAGAHLPARPRRRGAPGRRSRRDAGGVVRPRPGCRRRRRRWRAVPPARVTRPAADLPGAAAASQGGLLSAGAAFPSPPAGEEGPGASVAVFCWGRNSRAAAGWAGSSLAAPEGR